MKGCPGSREAGFAPCPGAVTYVPRPGTRRMKPPSESMLSALLSVMALTPNARQSSSSGGSFSPAG